MLGVGLDQCWVLEQLVCGGRGFVCCYCWNGKGCFEGGFCGVWCLGQVMCLNVVSSMLVVMKRLLKVWFISMIWCVECSIDSICVVSIVQLVIMIELVKVSVVVIIVYCFGSVVCRFRNCGIMVNRKIVFLGFIVLMSQFCIISWWWVMVFGVLVGLVVVIIGMVGVCYCWMFSQIRQVMLFYLISMKVSEDVVISVLRLVLMMMICVMMFSIRLKVVKQLWWKLWFRLDVIVVMVLVLGDRLMVQVVVKKVSQVESFMRGQLRN